MTLLFWIALGGACGAVGVVLFGIGYLLGLDVAARRVALVRTEMEQARETRRIMIQQWEA